MTKTAEKKHMILENLRGRQDGKTTGPVGLSFPFFQQVITTQSNDNHLTNSDIDVMIFLHKICNTNGNIREVSFHQIVEAARRYFEKNISASQWYTSMKKFIRLGLVHKREDDIYPVPSYQLCYFQDDHGQMNRYVRLSPFVFTKDFSNMTLAARKLYLLIAMQQGDSDFIFRSIHGEKGLLAFLRKNQSCHLQYVIEELEPYLAVKSLKKERGAYRKVYLGLKQEHRILDAEAEGEWIREPLEPPRRYPRKARFIEQVLQECGIGELCTRIHTMVQMLKHLGYRVIRQVIKTIRRFYDKHGTFPADLAYFIKKEIRITRQKEIIDIADNAGLMAYITWRNTEKDEETRHFEFANTFSYFNKSQLKRIFKEAAGQIGKLLPKLHQTKEAYYKCTAAADIFGIDHYRAIAYYKQIDAAWYVSMEEEMIRKIPMIGEEKAYHWFEEHMVEQIRYHNEMFPYEWKVEDFILDHSSIV
ncbi:hypothetical protein [Salibacterium aidingense]|uniref:hypothetical protein n=1 Tax=Salibacterium aidingense TaxID=384933 RepID=UPI0003F4F276|nr:hypothetical protein [Salibacterium aidingense]